jgi:hypothetical protein
MGYKQELWLIMDDSSQQNQLEAGNQAAERKPYHTPLLEDYGDLRDLTLGGSPLGSGDSGDAGTKWPG